MSGLRWTLKRLGAMGPAEIAHRARTALRDRLAPPAYARLAPGEAATRLFGAPPAVDPARAAAIAHVDRGAPGFAPSLAEARALLEQRWTLFGRPVQLDHPPRWRRNYASGAEWPDLPASQIDYRDSDAAHAPKYVWELGRLTFLPTLALAARLTGDGAYAERALDWLADWTAGNPLGRGVHSTSGIEMAVRVITVSWTAALLGPERAGDPRLAPALGLVGQQALYCRDHRSLGSSANNHLIAEYAAMAVAGALLPGLRGAGALARAGVAGLEHETLSQFHADGVNAEQAFGYLPFIWELLLAGFTAGEAAGLRASEPVRERLRDSLQFARTIRLPDGSTPHVGDEDDGRVLLASEGVSRLDLVGNALAAWLQAPGLSDGAQELAQLLCGRAAPAPRGVAEGMFEFPHGGYTVWRAGRVTALLDHGPLGLGAIAAHGHADALSIALYDGATPLILDPGTGAYQEEPAVRDRFRGTPWHSTVSFGGRSQSEPLGPFLWGDRPEMLHGVNGWTCLWPSGERHTRRVSIGARRLFIVDRVAGQGAELHFALAPGAEVAIEGTIADLRVGDSEARIEGEGIGPWRLEPIEVAPRFGTRLPAQRLVAAIQGEGCRTTIQLED
jgi:hypothetical protein